jgi:D-sedoheptulose 7-phosphate isomerase
MNFQQELIDLLPKIVWDGSTLDEGLWETQLMAAKARRLLFIGNGGSAGIASHMAIDWTKNGNKPALAFNDCASLTAVGNDLGFKSVFSYPLQVHAQLGDMLFAISSSGQSEDILDAVYAAKINGMKVATFSGFKPDNPLRSEGTINFYVPSSDYGLVECSHLILNHAILNAAIGLKNGS